MGEVLVFRRRSRRQKKGRVIVVPQHKPKKTYASWPKFRHDNILEFREEEIRRMARCIKRR